MKTSKRTENVLIDDKWNVVEPKKATMCVHNVYDEKGELIEQTIYNRTLAPKKEFNPNHDQERAMPEFHTESNDCHNPPGTDGGQFCSGDGAVAGSGKVDIPGDNPRSTPVSYPKAFENWDSFQKSTKLTGYSFDPTANRGFDFENSTDVVEFHRLHSDGSNPVYVIGVINHLGEPSRENDSAYISVVNGGKSPLMGYWLDPDKGTKYNDVSYPVNDGISEEKVREILAANAQEAAAVVEKDGTWHTIRTFEVTPAK